MSDKRPTRQGHPVSDNRSLRSVGERGPAMLENYTFIEKITHLDRERIPKCVVRARGTGAQAISRLTGRSAMSPRPSTPAPRSSTGLACGGLWRQHL